MLGADTLWDFHDFAVSVNVVNGAEGCKNLTEFKGDELVGKGADGAIGIDGGLGSVLCEAVGLEDNGDTFVEEDAFDLTMGGFGVEWVTGVVCDKCAGDVSFASAEFLCALEDFNADCVVDEVAVAGIHVDGWGKSGIKSSRDVCFKAFPVDFTMGLIGEKNGGHTGDFALGDEGWD